ncbi:MAG: trypsin-like peptidase domain-containing protein [Polyangiaceae bacterium]|nr:trypsin-like peptidase domain-containing protein [Polyangiaceae bacterium]
MQAASARAGHRPQLSRTTGESRNDRFTQRPSPRRVARTPVHFEHRAPKHARNRHDTHGTRLRDGIRSDEPWVHRDQLPCHRRSIRDLGRTERWIQGADFARHCIPQGARSGDFARLWVDDCIATGQWACFRRGRFRRRNWPPARIYINRGDGDPQRPSNQRRQSLQLQTTVPMASGASGGPLMDNRGRVIGIMQAMILEAPHVTFAIPIEHLRFVLNYAMTSPVPIPVAEFAKQTATPDIELSELDNEPVSPPTPPVPPEVLKGCSKADRTFIDTTSRETIDVTKYLCVDGNFTPCAHLYLGAAMALEGKLSEACASPRGMLLGGRTTTLKLADPEEQAKALRTLLESLGAGARETP